LSEPGPAPGGATPPLLELREVCKRFGGVVGNDHVSLAIGPGEIVGLIGPNGSGKTTLFSSIVGHHRVDSGSIRFQRHEITGRSVQQVARMGILRTFQHTRVYRDMTAEENLLTSLPEGDLRTMCLPRLPPPRARRRAAELLDFVGLGDRRLQRGGDLSFGQQRLLEIAMALMSGPRLLLLDEPTAGINPSRIESLMDRLRRINGELGLTLFVIEHNIPVIMRLARRILCLTRGRVFAEGPPERIRGDRRVIDAYLGAR
jgi:ABC-type branched-subunit amino acid transport system ATPase component